MWAILQSKKGLVTISDFLTLCEKPPPQRKLIQVGGTDHEDHFKCFNNASEMLDYLGVDVQKVSCFFGLWCVCVCVCVCVCCLLYTSPSPRDMYKSRMPSSA